MIPSLGSTTVLRRFAALLLIFSTALLLSACGSDADVSSDDADAPAADDTATTDDRPTLVVTTSILSDVVTNLVGDEFEVVGIMPPGADPHDFQPSAQQVAEVASAEAIIVNGAGFEEGLLDVIEAAEGDGVLVIEAMSDVSTLDFEDHEDHEDADDDHEDEHEDADEDHEDEHNYEDEHADEDHNYEDEHAGEDHEDEDEHAGEDHDDEDEDHDDEDHDDHDHEGTDPHFFTDPARMAVAARSIVDELIEHVDGVDVDALSSNADEYIAALEALDEDVSDVLSVVPDESRILVTNHEVFGYFAERYDFEVVGAVIPGGSTTDAVSARDLAELAETVEEIGISAIFADSSGSGDLADTLAAEVGEIAVVELYSESLGPDDSEGATYIDMVRTNATRIADALTG